MNKKFLFLSVIITVIDIYFCSDVHKCETTDDCLNNFNCKDGFCIHKGVFPMNIMEILVVIFMGALSMVATTAGIGGGAIYSAILMFVENFTATEAFPISNFVILFCSICTFYMGLKDKLANPDNKFVDYDMVVVFCPTMLLGTKIGVIFNKIVPGLILNTLLILSLAFSSYKSYQNALKQKRIEDNMKNSQHLRQNYSIEHVFINEERENELENPLNTPVSEKSEESKRKNKDRNDNMIYMLNNDYFEPLPFETNQIAKNNLNIISRIFKGKNSPLKLDRLIFLLIVELVLIVDQLLEGNNRIPSFIGLTKCSIGFWIVFSFFVFFCIWYAKFIYSKIKQEADQNRNSVLSHKSEFKITSNVTEPKISKILLICFLGGVISGMLGVGGGIVMAPLMLELGVHPKVAASTSNFLLIITSSAATILFMLSGQLIYTFAIAYAVPCCLASLIGSKYINEFVTRTNKNSTLIYCLFYVMIISLVILPINGIQKAVYDMKGGENIFELHNYCI